ncbi:MAG TPA: hypothetical protein VD998_03160 [Verrucomicrobiae bacterium]|nr:hypothetical protein [Verrucomicrobiae bacterium]
MFGLDPKTKQDLIEKLQKSRMSFGFNKSGVRNRLMMSIDQHQTVVSEIKHNHGFRFVLGSALAVVLMTIGTFAYADSTMPGDKLYFLDQFQEKLALKFPRSAESKVQLQAEILDERVKELGEIPKVEDLTDELRLKAVEESKKSLIDAIDRTSELKQNVNLKNRSKSDLNKLLIDLEKIAEKQESEVNHIRERSLDQETKLELEKNLEDIKKARMRARLESESQKIEGEKIERKENGLEKFLNDD